MSPWLVVASVLLVGAVARRLPEVASRKLAQSLDGTWAPVVAGIVTALVTWYVWGGLDRTGVIHDENAYLLQAQLFARLKWVAPARPLPEFFEQLHVFVTPLLASKYPPGTSLLLAPGALLGLPGLPVVLLDGLGGALVFAVARRVAGGAVALLTTVAWLSSYPVIYSHAMYLSEVPSSVAWVAAWWGLLRWYANDEPWGLLLVAAALGVCLLSRPLTAIALAVPIAVAVAYGLRGQPGRKRGLLPALALGAALAAVIPVWNWRTTGSARTDPLSLYSRVYFPFVKLGFGVDRSVGPIRALPPDLAMTSAAFELEHQAHTVRAIPAMLGERSRMIGRDMWSGWRRGLIVFAIVGLFVLPVPAWLAAAAFALQILAYLLYAHPAMWSLYYVEGQPLLAFTSAVGVMRVCTWLGRWRNEGRVVNAAWAATALAVLTLPAAGLTAEQVRSQIASDHDYYDRFRRVLRGIRDPKAVVFVRYAPDHNDNLSLVRNVADLALEPIWTVYDRGADNARLLEATDRVPYLFDEAAWRLSPLVIGSGASTTSRAQR